MRFYWHNTAELSGSTYSRDISIRNHNNNEHFLVNIIIRYQWSQLILWFTHFERQYDNFLHGNKRWKMENQFVQTTRRVVQQWVSKRANRAMQPKPSPNNRDCTKENGCVVTEMRGTVQQLLCLLLLFDWVARANIVEHAEQLLFYFCAWCLVLDCAVWRDMSEVCHARHWLFANFAIKRTSSATW